jgi:hypothetical protein
MDEQHAEVTYTDDRVPSRPILIILTVFVIFSTLLCVIAWRLLVFRESQLRPQGYSERALEAPHTVSEVRETLFDAMPARPPLGAEQRLRLRQYHWVDPGQRLVRIPVDREIDLMLREAQP